MSKIDTTGWQEFRLSELFGQARHTKYSNPCDLVPDEDGFEYICASNVNNGVNKDLPSVAAVADMTGTRIIAWGKQCPFFTYHDGPCVTSQGMYWFAVPESCDEISALFVCAMLNNRYSSAFDYSNCLIGKVADELTVLLPAVETCAPDWDYMEQYMSQVMDEMRPVAEELHQLESTLSLSLSLSMRWM